MSDTSARASRFALTLGSFDKKGLMEREGAAGAAGAGTEARGVGALAATGVGAAGCGRGALDGCDGARAAPGTLGAEVRGAGGGLTGAEGRDGANVGSGGVTGRDPVRGVFRAKGATPGVGGAGVGIRAGVGDWGRGAGRAAGVAAARPSAKSFSMAPPFPIVITPPQTLHRARTPAVGIFAGSTRKTDRHSGQETFTSLLRSPAVPAAAAATRPRPLDHAGDRRRRRNREASWRSSSFPWRAH